MLKGGFNPTPLAYALELTESLTLYSSCQMRLLGALRHNCSRVPIFSIKISAAIKTMVFPWYSCSSREKGRYANAEMKTKTLFPLHLAWVYDIHNFRYEAHCFLTTRKDHNLHYEVSLSNWSSWNTIVTCFMSCSFPLCREKNPIPFFYDVTNACNVFFPAAHTGCILLHWTLGRVASLILFNSFRLFYFWKKAK